MRSGIQVFASIRNPEAPSHPAARPRTAIRLLFGEAYRSAKKEKHLADNGLRSQIHRKKPQSPFENAYS
jgi:hypothetical protein